MAVANNAPQQMKHSGLENKDFLGNRLKATCI